MVHEAARLVDLFDLQPHPEGGYFKEFYRSPDDILLPQFSGPRSCATSIYFLLEQGQFSALHRIKSDEVWHFYLGDPLEIVEIDPSGEWKSTILGHQITLGQQLSYVVKAGNWFGSRPLQGSAYSLVGCSVSPGFDFQDFEMPSRGYFEREFPNLKTKFQEVTRF